MTWYTNFGKELSVISLISTNLKNFLISLKSFFEKTFCNYSPNKSFLSLSHSQKSLIINLKKIQLLDPFTLWFIRFLLYSKLIQNQILIFDYIALTQTHTHRQKEIRGKSFSKSSWSTGLYRVVNNEFLFTIWKIKTINFDNSYLSIIPLFVQVTIEKGTSE